jgi:hypothetical protein
MDCYPMSVKGSLGFSLLVSQFTLLLRLSSHYLAAPVPACLVHRSSLFTGANV